ncbi:hypothetical protein ACTI_45260 [Actinoplanes sp. OR16]|uniref:Rieske 2Fe-2S domain-containing protein n=1 Tax=Actinoplanes sp. OR16 TaxID=946334 RepID=UPI000F71647A|nr:Rieske 2Fe-2S domain-containing protein [Actinoplanes sp. OR16]BBH67841.1 hypothetical protein ACTI_45260 [Actinoplanes sp. OR16]
MDSDEIALLEHTWFPVARADDLRDRVLPANLLGRSLVVYRGPAGVMVAEALCPHRGVDLTEAAVRKGLLECPLHGWRFDGEGACVYKPKRRPGGALPRQRLVTYPAIEAYGHIWSCLSPTTRTPPRLAGWGGPGWSYGCAKPVQLTGGLVRLVDLFRSPPLTPPMPDRDDPTLLRWPVDEPTGETTYQVTVPACASAQARTPDGGHWLIADFAAPITAEADRVRRFRVVGARGTGAASPPPQPAPAGAPPVADHYREAFARAYRELAFSGPILEEAV